MVTFLALTMHTPSTSGGAVAPKCAQRADLTGTAYSSWSKTASKAQKVMPIGQPILIDTHGGTSAREIHLTRTGRYAILADQGVWIDILAAGRPLASTGHEHGPACSGIGKIVWFNLASGPATIRLSKAKAPQIRIMLVPPR